MFCKQYYIFNKRRNYNTSYITTSAQIHVSNESYEFSKMQETDTNYESSIWWTNKIARYLYIYIWVYIHSTNITSLIFGRKQQKWLHSLIRGIHYAFGIHQMVRKRNRSRWWCLYLTTLINDIHNICIIA